MIIDTHAHLDYPDFEPDFDQVLARAREAGVERIISIGTSLESSRRAVQLAEQYAPQVYAVVGIHPTVDDIVELGAHPERWIEELEKLATHPRVTAIGETGLDYYRLPDPEGGEPSAINAEYKHAQAVVFKAQIEIAQRQKLNLVIHQRSAWTDTLAILKNYQTTSPLSDFQVRGVFHCFGGTPDQAEEVIALGNLVSFTGIITFKNAPEVRATAAAIPVDRFMVETDCPYLAPVPHRGKRCEPAYTRQVAETIAQIRGMDLESVAMQTTATAENFFRLG